MNPHHSITPRKLSAAHLVVPPKKPAIAPFPAMENEAVGRGATLGPASDAFCDGLQDLLGQCGTNRNDLVTVLITACIEEGISTRTGILAIARRLDYNADHAAIVLAYGTGSNPERHSWHRAADGIYSLLG